MGKPIRRKSLDAVSAETSGVSALTKGHFHATMFVVAENLDTTNDTLEVALEGSPDDTHWTNAADASVTSEKKITASDFTEDPDNAGTYTASVTVSGTYYDYLRARTVALTDSANGDLAVTAWIMASGWFGPGVRGRRRE